MQPNRVARTSWVLKTGGPGPSPANRCSSGGGRRQRRGLGAGVFERRTDGGNRRLHPGGHRRENARRDPQTKQLTEKPFGVNLIPDGGK